MVINVRGARGPTLLSGTARTQHATEGLVVEGLVVEALDPDELAVAFAAR